MRGYHNRPDDTAEILRGGWLHTGDIGYLDDEGYLYVVDRKKDMIIRGGENIFPAELEAVLHEHPNVAEAAVVGVPDAVYGENVVAFVVVKPGAAAGAGRSDRARLPQSGPVQGPLDGALRAGSAQEQHRQDPAPRAARSGDGDEIASTGSKSANGCPLVPLLAGQAVRSLETHCERASSSTQSQKAFPQINPIA